MTLTNEQIDTLIDAANDRIEQLEDQLNTEPLLNDNDREHLFAAHRELQEARDALAKDRVSAPELYTEYDREAELAEARTESLYETIYLTEEARDLAANARISGLGLDERS